MNEPGSLSVRGLLRFFFVSIGSHFAGSTFRNAASYRTGTTVVDFSLPLLCSRCFSSVKAAVQPEFSAGEVQ